MSLVLGAVGPACPQGLLTRRRAMLYCWTDCFSLQAQPAYTVAAAVFNNHVINDEVADDCRKTSPGLRSAMTRALTSHPRYGGCAGLFISFQATWPPCMPCVVLMQPSAGMPCVPSTQPSADEKPVLACLVFISLNCIGCVIIHAADEALCS